MNEIKTQKEDGVLIIKNAPRALIAKAVIEHISMCSWKGDMLLIDVISLLFILKSVYGDVIIKDYQNDAFEIAEICKFDVLYTLHMIDELVVRNYISREGNDIYIFPFKETDPEKCIDITYHSNNETPLRTILTGRLLDILNPAVLEDLKTALEF